MKQSRIQPGPSAFLVLLLIATLLGACDEEQVVPPPPETVNASGIVWEMPLQTPLAGATVQLITNEFTLTDPNYVRPCDCQGDLCLARTTSNAEGLWAMEVPVKYDEKWAPFNMLIKVSKGTGPPQYNLFQPGGTNQGDLQILNPVFFFLFALDALAGGADLGDLSVMFGVAIGFIDPAYPQKIAMMPGVKVMALGGDPAEQFPITYLGEAGLPDPELTETSSLGVFYFTVPDANEGAAPSIKVSGDKPGSVFVSSYFPACPGSSGSAAVIDPYFKP
jgi:hypothetical protein